mgnify:CR=1 FL=1
MGLLASGSIESVARLLTTLLIFAFVLFITFWTSKFIAGYQKQKMTTGNMEVVETVRIAPNKYLQIVRAGEQYYMIALGKDTVNLIAQLDPEELQLKSDAQMSMQYTDFKSILEKAKNSRKKQADDNE